MQRQYRGVVLATLEFGCNNHAVARRRSIPSLPSVPTALGLFAGCGGLDLGAHRAGAQVVYGTDAMPEAADAYAQLLPEADFELADIRVLRSFPRADIVLGGYPCQPFSQGGARNPARDDRSRLFREFARAIQVIDPLFFIAENVAGLASLGASQWLHEQVTLFESLGRLGYEVAVQKVEAADYGVPQRRRRLFLVGVRRDLGLRYTFPTPTHLKDPDREGKRWCSHGEALHRADLPIWPVGEFYERAEPASNFSWYYMSRNRKARWCEPAKTVLANDRHVALHPASETMRLAWSRTADGSKQGWDFTGEYEHTEGHPDRPVLERPRRLSWRECAVLQTFPAGFEPQGSLHKKYEQIGNAVPPALAEAIVRPIVDGTGLEPIANEHPRPSHRAAQGPRLRS